MPVIKGILIWNLMAVSHPRPIRQKSQAGYTPRSFHNTFLLHIYILYPSFTASSRTFDRVDLDVRTIPLRDTVPH